MKRIIKLDKEARKKLKEGVNKAVDAIRPTLGPKGCSALIYTQRGGSPLVIDDGASIAKLLQDDDPVVNTGMALIKEVASQADTAGDGPMPKNSKVMTPEGPKRFGDLTVGDTICGTNGTFQKVIGVYDKGVKDVYEMHFTDGRIVECCKDHLWAVKRTSTGTASVKTVEELLSIGVNKKNKDGSTSHFFYVPKTVTNFSEKPLLIDPYLLGVLIGDGCLCSSGSIEISIGYNKEYILSNLVLPDGIQLNIQDVDYRNSFRVKFKGTDKDGHDMHWYIEQLGLLDKKSDSKFIPKEYLYNTIDNREALLNGLLSTDGYINSRGLIEYSTISKQLAEDFVELLRGLGRLGQVSVHTRENDPDSFSKKSIYRVYERQGYKYGVQLHDIVKTNRKEEMMCIKVENPDELYIMDNYIVTHNTSSSSILANEIISQGVDAIEAGASQKRLKVGITAATQAAIEYIEEHKKEIKNSTELYNVAKVSSNDDDMAKVISEAVNSIGKNGIIHVEDSFTTETTTSIISGLHYERGYLSPNFINDPNTGTFTVNDCKILLLDHSFSASDDAQHLLQLMAHKGLPVLVIADNVEDNVLSWFRANAIQGAVKICAIKTPGHGALKKAWIEDIAKFTGATILGDTTGIELDNLNPAENPASMNDYLPVFGTANVVVSSSETILMCDKLSEEAQAHVENLKAQLAIAPTPYDREQLEQRIVNMCGSVATIKVGGLTETEVNAKKAKYEDAKNATKSALEHGYICGGGTAYLAAAIVLQKMLDTKELDMDEDELRGFKIVIKALREITKQLGDNSNDVGDVIVRDLTKILEGEYGDDPHTGYDAYNNEICNMYERGIIDSIEVVENSLKKAASIASTVLMTATVITEEAEESDKINYALALGQRR